MNTEELRLIVQVISSLNEVSLAAFVWYIIAAYIIPAIGCTIFGLFVVFYGSKIIKEMT